MNNVVAVVKGVVGQVIALSPEGIQRLLIEGDRLFRGDQVMTGQQGMLSLQLQGGQELEIGQNSQWLASTETEAEPTQATQPPSDEELSVEELQQAIAAGVDPTTELDATAAGPGAGGAGGGAGGVGGGHSFVLLSETAQQLNPTVGFATQGLDFVPPSGIEDDVINTAEAGAGDDTDDGVEPPATIENTPPLATADSYSLDEDGTLTGNLLSNDSDADGDSLSVVGFSLTLLPFINFAPGATANIPFVGSLQINSDGSFSFTPLNNYAGPVPSFTYTISDGTTTSSATLNISINPLNDAPVNAGPEPQITAEDTPLTFSLLTQNALGSFDPDQDDLTTTLSVEHGILNVGLNLLGVTVSGDGSDTLILSGSQAAINNALAQLTYTPDANYHGPDSLNLSTSDGQLTTNSTVAITVTPVNDAPIANPDVFSGTEDSTVTGNLLLNDSDIDGDALSVVGFRLSNFPLTNYAVDTPVNIPLVGTLLINSNGEFEFTPLNNYNGTVPQITYTLSDGTVTTTSTLDISITSENDAPVIRVPAAQTTEEDTSKVFSLANLNALGVFDAEQDNLSVTLSVEHGVLNIGLNLLGASHTGSGTDTLTITGSAAAINNAMAQLTYVPDANYFGPDNLQISASDGQVIANNSVAISVTPVNDAPVASPDSVDVFEGDASVSGQILASDIDQAPGVPLQFSTSASVAGLTFGTDGSWSFDPSNPAYEYLTDGQELVIVVPFTVTDDQNAIATNNLTITLTGTNDAPVVDVALSDISADLTETNASLTANGTLVFSDIDTGDTPATTHTASTISAVGITLSAAQQDAIADAFSIDADGNWSFDLASPDYLADGDVITAAFTVTVTDDSGATATQDVTLTLTGSNDAPVIDVFGSDTSAALNETNAPLSANGTVLFSDIDTGDTPATTHTASTISAVGITLSAAQQDAIADAFSIDADGNWTFDLASPDYLAPGDEVTAVFTVTVTDDSGETATQDVTLTITGSNDAPVIDVANSDTSAALNETNAPLTANGTLVFSDIDTGDTPATTHTASTISAVGITLSGAQQTAIADAFSIDTDGNWSFDLASPDYLAAGDVVTAVFTVTVTDDSGATATQDVTLTITGSNDAPTVAASLDTLTATEDTAIVLNWTDFGISDVDSLDSDMGVIINQLPAAGSLSFEQSPGNWIAVTPDQLISKADIDAGKLRFEPAAHESGYDGFAGTGLGNLQADYAQIGFKPFDGIDEGAASSLSIDISPDADAPSLTLNGTSVAAATDFQSAPLNGASWSANINASSLNTGLGSTWNTNNPGGLLEIGTQGTYLGGGGTNQVIELERVTGDAANLYTDITAKAGSSYSLDFDYSPRAGQTSNSEIQVFWGGNLIATLNASSVGFQHFHFDLPADADGTYRLEFRATDSNSLGGVLDNIQLLDVRNTGNEDSWIRLSDIQANLIDTDGSETLAVNISDIPVGATLKDNQGNSFTAAPGSTQTDVTGWDLSTLSILPPSNYNGSFNLEIKATSTETSNLDSAETTQSLTVIVLPVNDAPVAVADGATVDEGGSVLIDLANNDTDSDNGLDLASIVITTNPANGTLTVNADGTVSYQHNGSETTSDSFTYTIKDASGATSNPVTVTVGVTPVNDAPSADSTSFNATQGGSAVAINLSGSDQDAGDSVESFRITSLPEEGSLLLNGVAISAAAVTAGTAIVTSTQIASGLLTYQPNNSFDSQNDGPAPTFTFQAYDGESYSATATATINVADATPTAVDDFASLTEGAQASTVNLVVILDTSTSMVDATYGAVISLPGGGTTTRFELAKDALENLINSYGNSLQNVMLVTFNGTATFQGWFDPSSAISTIQGLGTANGTDFDSALQQVQQNYGTPADVDHTYVYFVSDGFPATSLGLTSGSASVSASERADWVDFLESNDIDAAYAVGIGSDLNSDYAKSNLDTVAWSPDPADNPALTWNTDDGWFYNPGDLVQSSTNHNSNTIVVADPLDLEAVLQGTVQVFEGELLNGSISGSIADDFGADGAATPRIVAVALDSDGDGVGDLNASFNGTSYTLDLGASIGTLSINAVTGNYVFNPVAGFDIADDTSFKIRYTIEDGDGSQGSATLTLTLRDSSEVRAYDNAVQAQVQQSTTLDSSPAIVQADFSSTNMSSANGSQWVFDTNGNASNSNVVGQGQTPTGTQWQLIGSASVGDPSDDGDADSELRITDSKTSDTDTSGSTVTTPTFTLAANQTATLSFFVDLDTDSSGNQFQTGDTFSWALVNGSGVEVQSGTLTAADSDGTISRTITSGDTIETYRLVFSLTDNTRVASGNRTAEVRIDDIRLDIISTTTLNAPAITGNVIDNPNNHAGSSDAWGAQDSLGSEGALVSAINGVDFTGSTTVTGLYGSLTISDTGQYIYTPLGDVANQGQSETFSYTLSQADGDSSTAQLVIDIVASTSTTTPISGDGTLTGTEGTDVLLGGAAADTLNGLGGNDHLEGQGGVDNLLGGEGDDILIGGIGNDNLWGEGGSDTFVWHAGDTGSDVIKDFNLAQDKIDLSDLLQGEENASDIGDYIKLSASGDTLLISSTGSLDATGSNADVSIQLEGVNLSDPSLSLGATPAAIINSLIAGSDPTVKLDH